MEMREHAHSWALSFRMLRWTWRRRLIEEEPTLYDNLGKASLSVRRLSGTERILETDEKFRQSILDGANARTKLREIGKGSFRAPGTSKGLSGQACQ
jgi:hypothetical protein